MSDLTIRTPQGSWLNICDSEWYTRNEDNTEWLRLNPHEQEIRVRHGSNAYWLDVTCNRDSFYCPVDATADCWPGFTGNFDGGYIVGGGPTNYYITNCEEGADLKRKTYSGMTNNFDVVGGNFNVTSEYSNGYTLPLSWAGGRAEVNEILLNPGSESGQIFVEFDDMGDSSLRFRVYQNCKLLGDSKQYGNTFSVFYTEGEGPVFLRVDSLRPNARWFVRASAVNVDILSSINARAACFGTYGARMRCMIDGDVYYQEVQAYEAVHEIDMQGTMRIDYDFAETPSNIRVFYGQQEIAFRLDVVGKGSLAFVPNFNPIDQNLIVRIETQPFNNTWSYSIYCADKCGALANKCIPMEIEESPTCTGVYLPTDTIKSAGAPQTTINVDYSHAESGKVYISYVASSEVQFIVYKDGEVIAGSQPTKGKQVFSFRLDLDRGSNFITVVVVGPCCPKWEFTITDPVPEPDITIADASVVRPGKGDIVELCFPVTLSHRFDEPVYIDYETQQQTAYESIANTSLDYTPSVLIGSNVVVASVVEYGSAKVIFDGGIARFTNSALSAVNRAYLENVQTWFSDSGSRTLIINTTEAGTAYSIGTGVSQIPNIHNADVLHYAGSPIAVSLAAMLEYDIVYLFATNHSVNQGFANSRLSVETFNAIVAFADSGKSLFIGTVNGAYASAMNIFTQYFGTQARGSYNPTNVAGSSIAANYGSHVIRDGLGTFTFPGGAAGLTLTNVKRQAVAQDFCVNFVQEPTKVVQPTYVHPTQQHVFNSWDRWELNTLYPVGVTPPSSSRTWVTATVGGRTVLTNTANTSQTTAILSPELFDVYTFESTISVTRNTEDDDFIGIVIGSAVVNGQTHLLILWRTRYTEQHRWDFGVGIQPITPRGSGGFNMSGIVETFAIDGKSGNWKTSMATRIRVVRQGYSVAIFVTPVYNPTTQSPIYSFQLTLDLRNAPYTQFNQKGRYGYAVCSQQYAMWSEAFFEDVVRPPTQLIPTDYRRTEGTLRIEPCGLEGEICVPVCGSNLVGPDVTFLMKLIGSNVGFIERPSAVGTIINENVADCDQNTLIAVKQDIPNPYVRNDALDIFCNQKSANIDFSAVMERDLTFPVSGTYKFIFYGRDVAELFVDCDMIVRSAGGTTAVEAATFLYEGTKKLYITYYVAGGKTRKPAYAALAIISPTGQTFYASSANGWRGRVINEGTLPYCRQYLGPCDFRPTHGVAVANSTNDTNIGYSALRIRSTAHSDNCATGGQHYLMRKTISLPAGSYVIRGTSDDYMYVYLDCVRILSTGNDWRGVYAAGFNVAQSGNHELTVDYVNVPHCTPGWVKFVILNAQNQVVYSTHPDGWVSTYDSIPQGLYQSTWGGGTVLHISTSQGSGGPNYAWWSAERAINIPETGLYYVVSVADDNANLYIGCQLVATFSSYSQGWRASPMFELYEGDQYMALRCYNASSKHPNFAGFRLYKANGTLIYTSTAAGWLGSRRDLDFSGMG